MEKEIRQFSLCLGVDDLGIASVMDYVNPRPCEISSLLPDAKSIIVLAFRVLSSGESTNLTAAQNGYLDLGAFARQVSYGTSRFLENKMGARVVTIPLSYPFEIHNDRKARKAVADFSHRHAAVAAGLGQFGCHNLVIHPKFGTRVNFVSIITNLELNPSPQVSDCLCAHCDLCVKNCPGSALEDEGKTNVLKS